MEACRNLSRPPRLLALGLLVAGLAIGFVAAPLSFDALAKKPALPRPVGFVSDFSNMISPRAEATIASIAEEVKTKTGAEIAVATIQTTGGVAIEPYSVELFTEWGIGETGKDNGILILVAAEDHQMWIKTGYGLEGAIPDASAHMIYRDVLRPGFRAGEYDRALVTAVNMIADRILKDSGQAYAYGDSVPENLVLKRAASGGSGDSVSPARLVVGFGFFLFILMIVVMTFAARYGHRRGLGGFWMGGFGGSSGGFGGGFGGFGGGSCGGGGAGGGW